MWILASTELSYSSPHPPPSSLSSFPTMDVFYAYNYSTAGWLSLQALPLLLSPKLIVTLLSAESRNPTGEHLLTPFPNSP